MDRPADLTIRRLAERAGVPVSTVRYYERRGLLAPRHRTPAGYRVYGSDGLERLKFIREAQRIGFTLNDIAELLRARDSGGDPCPRVKALVEERLADVEHRIEELSRVRRVLRSTRKACENPQDDGRCVALDRLLARAARET